MTDQTSTLATNTLATPSGPGDEKLRRDLFTLWDSHLSHEGPAPSIAGPAKLALDALAVRRKLAWNTLQHALWSRVWSNNILGELGVPSVKDPVELRRTLATGWRTGPDGDPFYFLRDSLQGAWLGGEDKARMEAVARDAFWRELVETALSVQAELLAGALAALQSATLAQPMTLQEFVLKAHGGVMRDALRRRARPWILADPATAINLLESPRVQREGPPIYCNGGDLGVFSLGGFSARLVRNSLFPEGTLIAGSKSRSGVEPDSDEHSSLAWRLRKGLYLEPVEGQPLARIGTDMVFCTNPSTILHVTLVTKDGA